MRCELLLTFLAISAVVPSSTSTPPNIIFILADDLGFNDVSFHGSTQFPTPNIDALAFTGKILNNYYVQPICTPSRSALMTGYYPIHTGMQHEVIYADNPYGLPLQYKLLPEYLRDLGYSTHAIGKWHLGFFRRTYLPMERGFESHFGQWTGNMSGLDMHLGELPSFGTVYKYITDVYSSAAEDIIGAHDVQQPLFLYVAHTAVHSAFEPNPLQAPPEVVEQFNYIEDEGRRYFAAMTWKLDESVGRIVEALRKRSMLENSIIVFSTDNGGPANGYNLNHASNWPLRGVKASSKFVPYKVKASSNVLYKVKASSKFVPYKVKASSNVLYKVKASSNVLYKVKASSKFVPYKVKASSNVLYKVKYQLWEGGVRGAGLIWSPLLQHAGVSQDMVHITDWLPTLYSAAGGDVSSLGPIDGVDQWATLAQGQPGRRAEVLLNIDDTNYALRIGKYKLVYDKSYPEFDDWWGPSGRENASSPVILPRHGGAKQQKNRKSLIKWILSSKFPLRSYEKFPSKIISSAAAPLKDCGRKPASSTCPQDRQPCLFNVEDDPCEYYNLADEKPEIMDELLRRLAEYNQTVVPPVNQPSDPAADPALWGGALRGGMTHSGVPVNTKSLCPRLIDYLAIVGVKNPSKDSSIQAPDLLRRYPLEDHKDFPFPNDVVYFCQPEGCVSVGPKRNIGRDSTSFVFCLTDKDTGELKEPEGCVSVGPKRNIGRDSTSFVFCLTDKDTGKVRFGVCLNFYRPVERLFPSNGNRGRGPSSKRDAWRKSLDKSSDSAFSSDHRSTVFPSDSDRDSHFETELSGVGRTLGTVVDSESGGSVPPSPKQQRKRQQRLRSHSLTSLCVLSHHPFLSSFRECLTILRRLIEASNENTSPKRIGASSSRQNSKDTIWSLLTGQSQESVPSYILHDVREIETWILRLLSAPVPVPGKTRIELDIITRSIREPLVFALPDHTRFSLVDFPLHLPLELLGVDTCLKVLTLVLLECKVVIQSRDYNALTMSVMAFVNLIYPLEYMFPVIPLLPTCMPNAETLLLAPTPFLIGIPTSFLLYKKNLRLPDDVWLVDLDTNKIYAPPKRDELPPLPEVEGSVLKHHLQQALASMTSVNPAAAGAEGQAGQLNASNPFVFGHDIDSVDIATRVAMVRFFNSPNLLSNFTEHTRTLRLYPRPVVAFQTHSFLRSRPQASPFLFCFAKTQAVEYLAEWCLTPTNVAFHRVHTGIFDPVQIGDKPKWYAQDLDVVRFQVWESGCSLEGALRARTEDIIPTGTSESFVFTHTIINCDMSPSITTASTLTTSTAGGTDTKKETESEKTEDGQPPRTHRPLKMTLSSGIDSKTVYKAPITLQLPDGRTVSPVESICGEPTSSDSDSVTTGDEDVSPMLNNDFKEQAERNSRKHEISKEAFPASVASQGVSGSSESVLSESGSVVTVRSAAHTLTKENTVSSLCSTDRDVTPSSSSVTQLPPEQPAPGPKPGEPPPIPPRPKLAMSLSHGAQSPSLSSLNSEPSTITQTPPLSPKTKPRTPGITSMGGFFARATSISGGSTESMPGSTGTSSPQKQNQTSLFHSFGSFEQLAHQAKEKMAEKMKERQGSQESLIAHVDKFTMQARKAAGELKESSAKAAVASRSTFDDLTHVSKNTFGDLTKHAKEVAKKRGLFKVPTSPIPDAQLMDPMMGGLPPPPSSPGIHPPGSPAPSLSRSESSGDGGGGPIDFSSTGKHLISSLTSEIDNLTAQTSSMFSDIFASAPQLNYKTKSKTPFGPFPTPGSSRKGMVEKTTLIRHTSPADKIREMEQLEARNAVVAENQAFLKEGIGWLKYNRVKKLMEDENLRNLVISRINQTLDKKIGPDDHIDDVCVQRGVWRGMLKLLQAMTSGLEHTYTDYNLGGAASAYQLCEMAHTHFWTRELEFQMDQSSSGHPYASSGASTPRGSHLTSPGIEESGMFPLDSSAASSRKSSQADTRLVHDSLRSPMSPGAESQISIETVSVMEGRKEGENGGSSMERKGSFSMGSLKDLFNQKRVQLQKKIAHGIDVVTDSDTGSDAGSMTTNNPFVAKPKYTSSRSTVSDSDLQERGHDPVSQLFLPLAKKGADAAKKGGQLFASKSSLSSGFRFHGGNIVSTSRTPSPETGRCYLFEGLLRDRSPLWDEIQFWEDVFIDAVAQERDMTGMDQGPSEMMERYKTLSDTERKRLEHEEDRLLATMLYNLIAFMVMFGIERDAMRKKARRLLGKCHIGLIYSQEVHELLDQVENLHGNDIDLKPLPSRLLHRQSFTVHQGTDSSGELLFLEVRDDGLIIRSVSGTIVERWWFERIVNMTYSPKNKVLCLWKRVGGETKLYKFHTRKVRKGGPTGQELGGEFPVQDLKTGEGGLLQVCMEGVGLLFANSKFFVRLDHIRKCFTQKGGIFVLEEYNPKARQLIQRKYQSNMADQICYAVLCVFSYVAAGQQRSKASSRDPTNQTFTPPLSKRPTSSS
ncbi:unnamed protein product [Cyprideis torosa]|uniref:MAP kinase-activating death domain protein n=1 Tax=Cyprideis torosa TaxID=163714 RepID=A0A7R8W875_9CRUS|nr:unnamed protein product [Cyprideis torosa]CAG0888292.1 unnamed protein product [Cyprideis torosa]